MADPYTVHTSTLFDPKKKSFLSDISITVDPKSGNIIRVFKRDQGLDDVPDGDIDLRGKVVMPGFVDAHTHIFLHDYRERPSVNQKRDESYVERVVRATNHCRTALLAGYTTYRDLSSESMQEADVGIRDCINRGLMPGPRLFVATRALASTGGYEPRTESHQTCLPLGGEVVDGPESARVAVRRRIAAGADIIKFFADYRRRTMRYPPAQQHPYIGSVLHPVDDPNPNHPNFDQEEMDTIVREAKMAGCPVAAHAGTLEAAFMAVKAGVTTIEHAYTSNDELFQAMIDSGCIFVPTLAVIQVVMPHMIAGILQRAKRAYDMGVRMACGGDIGPVSHGMNCREMELMIEAGIPLEDVLESCFIGGWESVGGDRCGLRFGWFEEGVRADIIALQTDPRQDKEALRKVDFVMKDAMIWKKNGAPINMNETGYQWTST